MKVPAFVQCPVTEEEQAQFHAGPPPRRYTLRERWRLSG